MDVVSELFNLIKNNNYDKFIKTLNGIDADDIDIDLNIRDSSNNYLINYTILNNNTKATKLLIEKGAKIDILDVNHQTLLYMPIRFGFNDIIKVLMDANSDNVGVSLIELTDLEGDVPMNYCIYFNNIYALKLILKYTDDLNNYNEFGYNSVHIAVSTGKLEICKLIFEDKNKFDINSRSIITGETALHIAVNNKFKDIVELILELNPDLDLQDYENEYTALHYAVSIDEPNIVKLLLENGADPNLQDAVGNTCLHYAIYDDNLKIIDMLLFNKNTKYVINFNIGDIDNNLPLHILFLKNIDNYVHLLELFIKNTNLNHQNDDNSTVMHYLSNTGLWIDYVNILQKKKLDIFISNLKQMRPVDYIGDNFDLYIDMTSKSYVNTLRKKDYIWNSDWENICKNEINKISDDKLKILKKLQPNKKCKKDICECIAKDKIMNIYKNKNSDCLNTSYPSKQTTLCYTINKSDGGDIKFCSFTGAYIDVLIGLVYLYNKFDNVCIILDKNIHTNPELLQFYNDMGIKNEKYFLNFEIVWTLGNLFFSTNFDNNFIKCTISGKRFSIIPLGIQLKHDSHANYIIYDSKTNEIERFETYGSASPYRFDYDAKKLDKLLEEKFKKLNDNIKYVRPREYLPRISFQFFDSKEYATPKIGDPRGFCAAWAIWYTEQRLTYSDINRKNLVKVILNTMRTSKISFKNFIRNYSKNITDLRDDILTKTGVTINDLLNDQQTVNQVEKITQEVMKLINA